MMPFGVPAHRGNSPDRMSPPRKEKRSRATKKSRHTHSENEPLQAQQFENGGVSWRSSIGGLPRLDTRSSTPQPISMARYQEGLGPQQKIDAFLLSLPLGISSKDAAIESAVADRLTSLYEEISTYQQKLDQWMYAAAELKDAVTDQQNEIEIMRKQEDIVSGLRTPQAHSRKDLADERGYQQQEIAELKDMVSSLRQDLLSRHQSGTREDFKAVLGELDRTQQDMSVLRQEHEVALRDQANFHQQEQEDLHFEMQNLEALIQDLNIQLSESLATSEQAEKNATDASLELRSMAEEKEFMVLQIDELTEENLRLQRVLQDTQQSETKNITGLSPSQAAETPASELALKTKTPEKYRIPDMSLQDWTLEACWPDQMDNSCQASPLVEDKAERSSNRSSQAQGEAPGAADECAESGADTPEHLKEVLEMEMTPRTVEMQPMFELSPPQQTPRLPKTESRPSRSLSRSAESILALAKKQEGDAQVSEAACRTDLEDPERLQAEKNSSGTRVLEATSLEDAKLSHARIVELERQLQDSGRKVTAELSSVIEMHEGRMAEAEAKHSREMSSLQSELVDAQENHAQQLEEIEKEYREDRDQLSNELLLVRNDLEQQKQMAVDTYANHLEETSELRAQLEQQSGLEGAIAEDLQQINAVVASQDQELQDASSALADCLAVLRHIRTSVRTSNHQSGSNASQQLQNELIGMQRAVNESQSQLSSADSAESAQAVGERVPKIGSNTLRGGPSLDSGSAYCGSLTNKAAEHEAVSSGEVLHSHIRELEDELCQYRETSELLSESHADEMLALHRSHQDKVAALQAQLKNERNHVAELEEALEEESGNADRAKNALLDCQEMLEEIQAFSEQQALQIESAEGQPRITAGEEDASQLRASRCSLALEVESLREGILKLEQASLDASSAEQTALQSCKEVERQLAEAQQLCQSQQAQLESAQCKEQQLEEEVQELRRLQDQSAVQLAKQDMQCASLSENMQELARDKEEMELQLKEMRIECLAAAATDKVKEHEALQLQDEILQLHQSQAALQKEMQVLQDTAQDLIAQLSESKAEQEILNEQLKISRETSLRLEAEIAQPRSVEESADTRKVMTAMQSQIDASAEERDQLAAERTEALSLADSLQANLREAEDRMAELTAEKLASVEKACKLEAQLQELAEERARAASEGLELQTSLRESLRTATNEVASISERLKASEELCVVLQTELNEHASSTADDNEASCIEERRAGPIREVAQQTEETSEQRLSGNLRARVRRSLEQREAFSSPGPPALRSLPTSASKAGQYPSTPVSQIKRNVDPASRLPHSTKNYKSLTALSNEAVRELHFNPVYGETSPSRPRKLILSGLTHPTSDRGPNSSRIGRTKAISPNRWMRSKAENGSPRWRPEKPDFNAS